PVVHRSRLQSKPDWIDHPGASGSGPSCLFTGSLVVSATLGPDFWLTAAQSGCLPPRDVLDLIPRMDTAIVQPDVILVVVSMDLLPQLPDLVVALQLCLLVGHLEPVDSLRCRPAARR